MTSMVTVSTPDRGTRTLERMLAALCLLTLLVKVPGLTLFPVVSVVLAIALLPVTLRELTRVGALRVLLLATGLAVVTGLALSLWVPSYFGTRGDTGDMASVLGWLLCFPLILMLGVWASRFFTLRATLLLISAGGIVGATVSEGPLWKGSLGIYTTLFVLAAVSQARPTIARSVLLASAVLSSVWDARSMTVVTLLALVMTFVTPKVRKTLRAHPVRSLFASAALISGVLFASIWAMRAGVLGAAIQERTLHQMEGGRSVLTTGRQEWAATLQLFAHNPLGFGVATQVDGGLASAGVTAVKAAQGDYTAPYFRVFVFGPRTDLHSMLADLWYHFGFGGVAFAAVLASVLAMGITRSFNRSIGLAAAVSYAALSAGWDLFFSPMGNADRMMAGLLAALIVWLAQKKTGDDGNSRSENGTAGIPDKVLHESRP